MADIENFVHGEEYNIPDLIKIAIIHYQFETIHPLLDGNGRVGRLLITLYLVDKHIIKKPILYLSAFLEKNRTNYYDDLMRVREKNDLNQWLKFFLVGIIETAKNGIKTFDAILQLQKTIDNKIQVLGSRANNAQKVIHYLYERPAIDPAKIAEIMGLSLTSAYKLKSDLEKLGIITESSEGTKGKYYIFKEYLELFK